MIKTFAYNEFDFAEFKLDKEKVLKEIEQFIEQGGNLNYPVKKEDNFIPPWQFLENNLGVDFVKLLIHKNYLNSPGTWTLDAQSQTIKESITYHSYWYRDNYSKYSDVVSEGFRELCRQYNKNPVFTSYEYKDNYDSRAIGKEQLIKYDKFHPLLKILRRMPFKEMFDVFVQEISNAKELLHEVIKIHDFRKTTYTEKFMYELIIQDSDDSVAIISSLFKNNIVATEKLMEDYDFRNNIIRAIGNNDFEFMEILKSKSSNPHYLGQLDEENTMYNSFLRACNTPDMAKLLIDSGCQVVKKTDTFDSMLLSKEYFPLSKLDTIKFIMEYVPLDYMTTYENTFWEYLKSAKDLENFKIFSQFITSKGFPIEKYDLFNVCPGDDWKEKIQTCLDLGANPNMFSDLIQQVVSDRDISTFKAINRTKLLNLYSPDGIYYLLNVSSHTKSTLDLLDKAEKKDINSFTSFGKPAWFAANSKDKVNKILSHIESFNQLDENGNNWITNYYAQDIRDKYAIAPLVLEMAAKEDKKNHRLLILTCEESKSNLLHHGFKFSEYRVKELRQEFIEIIKAFSTNNLNELFNSLDEHGLFPTDYLIKSKTEKGVWNQTMWDARVDTLLKLTEYNLDYDKKNIHGVALIDSIRQYYKINDLSNNFIEPVEKAYFRYQLHEKLEKKLVPENKKNIRSKI